MQGVFQCLRNMLKEKQKRGEKTLKTVKLKEKEGVTVLALSITIIILLILADPHIFLNIPQ